MPDKRFLPVLFVGGVIFVGIALLFLLQGLSRRPSPTPTPATNAPLLGQPGDTPELRAFFGAVEGTVTVTRADGSTGAAIGDMQVYANDTVTTAANSAAEIIIFGGARLALDANTSVRMDTLLVDPARPQKQDMRLSVVSGRVWSRVLKLLDPESKYEVEYTGVVSGVRGTAFVIAARGPQYRLDVFDGNIGVTGKTVAAVPVGFSLPLNMNAIEAESQSRVEPTPDEIRNDPWIRTQLEKDASFALAVQSMRKSLGAGDTTIELNHIGNEAGPYTMNQPGAMHSGFMRVEVESDLPVEQITAGSSWQLHAFAVIETPNGPQRREVTTTATWQVSDPNVLTISSDGRVESIDRGMDGNDVTFAQVVARWNDGTHEHSGVVHIRIQAVRDTIPPGA